MIGAVFGDIVGSVYEWENIKTKDFELYQDRMFFTDDSVMTLAVGKALLEYRRNGSDLHKLAVRYMQEFGRKYEFRGYGDRFRVWLYEEDPKPYSSCGNGAAMRVSACGWLGETLEEVKEFSRLVTEVSHNHSEGIKGAEATAVAIYLARVGKDKDEIQRVMREYYLLEESLDWIRLENEYNETCQGTVPQAIQAFLEAESFEDTIRNAISLGGDSDTLAAIAGSIAEAYYGVTEEQKNFVKSKLDDYLWNICEELPK